jgi:hypothetical protein
MVQPILRLGDATQVLPIDPGRADQHAPVDPEPQREPEEGEDVAVLAADRVIGPRLTQAGCSYRR